METKAVKIIRKHLGNDQVSNIFNDNEPLWDDIVSAVTEALEESTEPKYGKHYSFNSK